MSNKAAFDETIAKIMGLLVESCPVHRRIGAADLGMEEGTWNAGRYESTGDDDFLSACLKWLHAEGLIRGESAMYVPTLLGLEIFNAIPLGLKSR